MDTLSTTEDAGPQVNAGVDTTLQPVVVAVEAAQELERGVPDAKDRSEEEPAFVHSDLQGRRVVARSNLNPAEGAAHGAQDSRR